MRTIRNLAIFTIICLLFIQTCNFVTSNDANASSPEVNTASVERNSTAFAVDNCEEVAVPPMEVVQETVPVVAKKVASVAKTVVIEEAPAVPTATAPVAFADSITVKYWEWNGDSAKKKSVRIAARWTSETQDPKGAYLMLDPTSPYLSKVNGAGRIFRVNGSKDASTLSQWLWDDETQTVAKEWTGERIIEERN